MLLLFFGLARFVCMISTRASCDLNSNREKRKHTHTLTHYKTKYRVLLLQCTTRFQVDQVFNFI